MKFRIKAKKLHEENEKVVREPKFTDFQLTAMSADEKMVHLLDEILGQLKVLNHQMTPAKGFSASELEQAVQQLSVAEDTRNLFLALIHEELAKV